MMGSHKAGFSAIFLIDWFLLLLSFIFTVPDARGGIPAGVGGDKPYPASEYHPGFFKSEGALPGRVVNFEFFLSSLFLLYFHFFCAPIRKSVRTGAKSKQLEQDVEAALTRGRDYRVEERERALVAEREQQLQDVLALDNWKFDRERKEREKMEKAAQQSKEKEEIPPPTKSTEKTKGGEKGKAGEAAKSEKAPKKKK
jgi:hypothetical protein